MILGNSTVVNGIDELIDINGDVLQFGINPTSYQQKPHIVSHSTMEKVTDRQYLVYHGKYIYNFCRENSENQIESLCHELTLGQQLGCDIVVHQGKNILTEKMSKVTAINNYVSGISRVIELSPHLDNEKILLENSAGQGTEMGSTLRELAYIFNQFDESSKEHIGICLDTCHAFVSGMVDFRKKDSVQVFLNEFDTLIGLDNLRLIHLNDSNIKFGGKRDVHGDIDVGHITNPSLGGSDEGLKLLVTTAKEREIPMVFETPCAPPNQWEHQTSVVNSWA